MNALIPPSMFVKPVEIIPAHVPIFQSGFHTVYRRNWWRLRSVPLEGATLTIGQLETLLRLFRMRLWNWFLYEPWQRFLRRYWWGRFSNWCIWVSLWLAEFQKAAIWLAEGVTLLTLIWKPFWVRYVPNESQLQCKYSMPKHLGKFWMFLQPRLWRSWNN